MKLRRARVLVEVAAVTIVGTVAILAVVGVAAAASIGAQYVAGALQGWLR